MNDLDKILGVEPIVLDDNQQVLLDRYTNSRKGDKLTSANNQEFKNILLSYLNEFYNSLESNQQKIAKAWLTYEMCSIDSKLVTSLKISEFAIKNNLQDKLTISADNNSFMFEIDSNLEAENVKKLFSSQYKNVECRVN